MKRSDKSSSTASAATHPQAGTRRGAAKMSVGAAWFREALALARRPFSRHTGLVLIGGAALGAGGCLDDAADMDVARQTQQADEQEVRMRAIDVQRKTGWNAGNPDGVVTVSDAVLNDVDGTTRWRELRDWLPQVMAPASPGLAPFYVPTLFQSLQGQPGWSLHESIRPSLSASMIRAYQRGQALSTLMEQAAFPPDLAIVVDLPGPQSIAVAAALAPRYDPVFDFDNWPHPAGVVPAQETLAAALYYAPLFERERAHRGAAPPVWVLDSSRLAPYADESTQFDNRYLARLPPAAALRQLGILHILYITADGSQQVELDDLNEDFVAYGAAGVDVKMLAMSDFVESEETPPAELADLHWPFWVDGGWWYYGGDPWMHGCFWRYYGWYGPSHLCASPGPRPLAWRAASRGHRPRARQPSRRDRLTSARVSRRRAWGASACGPRAPRGKWSASTAVTPDSQRWEAASTRAPAAFTAVASAGTAAGARVAAVAEAAAARKNRALTNNGHVAVAGLRSSTTSITITRFRRRRSSRGRRNHVCVAVGVGDHRPATATWPLFVNVVFLCFCNFVAISVRASPLAS